MAAARSPAGAGQGPGAALGPAIGGRGVRRNRRPTKDKLGVRTYVRTCVNMYACMQVCKYVDVCDLSPLTARSDFVTRFGPVIGGRGVR